MAIALAQPVVNTAATYTSNTIYNTFTQNTTSGNTIVVIVGLWDNATAIDVSSIALSSGSAPNGWVKIADIPSNQSTVNGYAIFATAGIVGGTTPRVTVTATATLNIGDLAIMELNGMPSQIVTDGTASTNASTGTALTTNAINVGTSDTIVIGAIGVQNGVTAKAGLTTTFTTPNMSCCWGYSFISTPTSGVKLTGTQSSGGVNGFQGCIGALAGVSQILRPTPAASAISYAVISASTGDVWDSSTANWDDSTSTWDCLPLDLVVAPVTYYVSPTGSDSNTGLASDDAHAWQTITKVNAHTFAAGNIVLFKGGSTFTGKLYLNGWGFGSSTQYVTFGSWGTGRATIYNGASDVALYAYNQGGIVISNLNFANSGTSTGGLSFYADTVSTLQQYIRIDSCDVSGFTGYGINIGGGATGAGFNDVRITNCTVHGNTNSGISVYANAANVNTNIYVGYCSSYSNTGGSGSGSGSGIVLGGVSTGTIEYCVAYSNGASCTNAAGPVGIWTYNSTSVIIQYCESYSNTHGSGGGDGDGFDLDISSTNCIVQYCYSHNNTGYGILVFSGASPANTGSIVRYNICQNNASEILLYGNGTTSVTNALIYNNTCYNSSGTLLNLNQQYLSGCVVENNIFYSSGTRNLIYAAVNFATSAVNVKYNDYYSTGTNVWYWNGTGYTTLTAWKAATTGQGTGDQNVDPVLRSPGSGGTINAGTVGATVSLVNNLLGYHLKNTSTLSGTGTTITSPGSQDFYGFPVQATPGAATYVVTPQPTASASTSASTTVEEFTPPNTGLVQHVATAMANTPVNTLTITFPNVTLANNLLICGVQFKSSGSITSVKDNLGNSFTAGPTATDSTDGRTISGFYLANCTAGLTSVVVTFSGLTGNTSGYGTGFPHVVLDEWYGMNASPFDVSSSSASSKSAGSLTTTANGDLVWHWGVDFSDTVINIGSTGLAGPQANLTSITKGSGFTLISADRQVGSCEQYQIQVSAGAINPSFTTSGAATWGSIAMAFKTGTVGTAPSNTMRIVGVQHTSLAGNVPDNGAEHNVITALQFPCVGNLLVGLWQSGAGKFTGVTDSASNTWSFPAGAETANSSSGNLAQVIYAANSTPSTDYNISAMTFNATVTYGFLILYDVVNAAASPYDTGHTSTGNSTTNAAVTADSITPTTVNGLVFNVWCVVWNTANATTTSGAFFDPVINALESNNNGNNASSTSASSLDEDMGAAHVYNTSTSAISFVYGMNTTASSGGGVSGAGQWASASAAFKTGITSITPRPQATSNSSASVTVRYIYRPSPTASTNGTASVTERPCFRPSPQASAVSSASITEKLCYRPSPHASASSSASTNVEYIYRPTPYAVTTSKASLTAPVFLQAYNAQFSGTNSATLAYPKAQALGNLNIVVVGFSGSGSQTATCSDTANGSYTAIGPVWDTTNATGQYVFYRQNIASAAAGANTVTVTISSSSSTIDLRIYEVNDISAFTSLSEITSSFSTTTTLYGSTAITTTGTDLIFCAYSSTAGGDDWVNAGTGGFDYAQQTGISNIDTFRIAPAGSYTNRPAASSDTRPWVAQAIGFPTVLAPRLMYRPAPQASANSSAYIQNPVPQPLVQANNTSGGLSPSSVTCVYNQTAQTAGNTNIVIVTYGAGSTRTATIADSANGSYTLAVGPIRDTANQETAYIYYFPNIASAASGTNTVTATFNGGTATVRLRIYEYSGVLTSSPLDATGNNETTTDATNGEVSITTSNSKTLIVTGFYTKIGLGYNGAGSGFTSAQTGGTWQDDYTVVASPGTYTDTPSALGSNTEWVGVAASFIYTAAIEAPKLLYRPAPVASAGSSAALVPAIAGIHAYAQTLSSAVVKVERVYAPAPHATTLSSAVINPHYAARPPPQATSLSSASVNVERVYCPTPHATSLSSASVTVRLIYRPAPQAATNSSSTVTERPCLRPILSQIYNNYIPASTASGDPNETVGLQFTVSVAGYVTAVNFYKIADGSTSHQVGLWNGSGTLLASATSSGEANSTGWVSIPITPTAVSTGVTYTVAYYETSGTYPYQHYYYQTAGLVNTPVTNGFVTGVNGCFHSGSFAYPSSTYEGNNYGVDLTFQTYNTISAASSATVTEERVYCPAPKAAAQSSASVNDELVYRPLPQASASSSAAVNAEYNSGDVQPKPHATSLSSASVTVRLVYRPAPQASAASSASVNVERVYRPNPNATAISTASAKEESLALPKPQASAASSAQINLAIAGLGAKASSGSSAAVSPHYQREILVNASSQSSATISPHYQLRIAPQATSLSSASVNVRLVYRPAPAASTSSSAAVLEEKIFCPKPTASAASTASVTVKQIFRPLPQASALSSADVTVELTLTGAIRPLPSAFSTSSAKVNLAISGLGANASSASNAAVAARYLARVPVAASALSSASVTVRLLYRPAPSVSASSSAIVKEEPIFRPSPTASASAGVSLFPAIGGFTVRAAGLSSAVVTPHYQTRPSPQASALSNAGVTVERLFRPVVKVAAASSASVTVRLVARPLPAAASSGSAAVTPKYLYRPSPTGISGASVSLNTEYVRRIQLSASARASASASETLCTRPNPDARALSSAEVNLKLLYRPAPNAFAASSADTTVEIHQGLAVRAHSYSSAEVTVRYCLRLPISASASSSAGFNFYLIDKDVFFINTFSAPVVTQNFIPTPQVIDHIPGLVVVDIQTVPLAQITINQAAPSPITVEVTTTPSTSITTEETTTTEIPVTTRTQTTIPYTESETTMPGRENPILVIPTHSPPTTDIDN